MSSFHMTLSYQISRAAAIATTAQKYVLDGFPNATPSDVDVPQHSRSY